MHLPRTILLGLGPLLSLWALGAEMVSQPADGLRQQAAEQRLTADALPHFIQPMVSFLLLAADQQPPRATRAPQAMFGFEAASALLHMAGAEPAGVFAPRPPPSKPPFALLILRSLTFVVR